GGMPVGRQTRQSADTSAISTAFDPGKGGPDTEDEQPAIIEQDQFGDSLPVANVKKSPLGNLVVEMENGQHWRQLNSDNTRVTLPADTSGLRAEIKRGFLGSVTMRILGTGRSFKVSRIK
ncbi:MAG: hypothetical protein OEM25_09000, partial [Gammaproteobacteria bacterium]|nr:hypothetical protein [Gammaproteobacteria bacterium]